MPAGQRARLAAFLGLVVALFICVLSFCGTTQVRAHCCAVVPTQLARFASVSLCDDYA